jgi:hypothetical protein
MDSAFKPPNEFSVVPSKSMEYLCLLLEDGVDGVRRVAVLQLDDKAMVEYVCSCMFLIFRKSGLKEISKVGLRRDIGGHGLERVE